VSAPVVTLLSDYGLDDPFVGVCHGVIVTICPAARVIDISHGVARQDVRMGAQMLAGSLPFMPVGVHVAVVDPEVGARRRAVALETGDGRRLVGPDNGLLMRAAERCGGIVEAVEIAGSPFRLEPVSATFHGRDIFAPVAAHLAAGAALADAGMPQDPRQLVVLDLPEPRREDGALVVQAVLVDRFGNVQLNAGHEALGGASLKLGQRVRLSCADCEREAIYARTFVDVPAGEALLYEDADRRLAVAVSQGNAAAELHLAAGDELRIAPA